MPHHPLTIVPRRSRALLLPVGAILQSKTCKRALYCLITILVVNPYLYLLHHKGLDFGGGDDYMDVGPPTVDDDDVDVYNTDFSVTNNNNELIRLSSPHELGLEATALQIQLDLMVVVGGFSTRSLKNCTVKTIQFFNISEQRWMVERYLELPDGVAQTHQGTAYDPFSGYLYVISGQLGGGCSPATTKSVRIHVSSGEIQELPPLPQARYHPGAVIVPNPADPSEVHLHVFGGAAENRYQSARNHWRIIITGNQQHLESLIWEELEPTIDGGTHGRAFHRHGDIFYTAFCDVDQIVFHGSERISLCMRDAKKVLKQSLHHHSDAGLTMVYATKFSIAKKSQLSWLNHWEQLGDMPYPACHVGFTMYKEKAIFVGGGIVTTQEFRGSPAPRSLKQVQILDVKTRKWESTIPIFFASSKRSFLYNMFVWLDQERNQIYGLRSNDTLVIGNIGTRDKQSGSVKELSSFEQDRASFLRDTRSLAVNAFTTCVASEESEEGSFDYKTVFDESDGYEHARNTWNKAKSHLQYPDVVIFPKTAQDVSVVVKCAKRSGYHVCGRNGKHSFESDTCTYGIVVDVSLLKQVQMLNRENHTSELSIHVGAGLTLGRVAIDVEDRFQHVIPMGHCASVGITGLVLVGGQGILTRVYGMTSDYVSAVELVDADGKIITATKYNEYSDYLWLARGGGSGIQHFPGIITAMQFSGLPQAESLDVDGTSYTSFRINYDNPNPEKASQLLAAWQDFYQDPAHLNDPLFSRLTVEPWMFMTPNVRRKRNFTHSYYTKKLFLACYFYGNSTMHAEFVKRYLHKLESLLPDDNGQTSQVSRMNSLQFHRQVAGVKSDQQLVSGHDGWDLNERWKGYSAVANKPVSKRAFYLLAQNIYEAKPYSKRYAEVKPLGGAVKKLDKFDSAFWHRDALWWVLSNHFFPDEATGGEVDEVKVSSRKQHNLFIDAMGASFSGLYAGYIDHSGSPGRDLSLYYGENGQRVSKIKMQRDPHNLFRLYVPNSKRNAPINPASKYAPSVEKHASFTVDILSVGSRTRLDLLSAQQKAFASHLSVRNFFNATEIDDADPDCAEYLTLAEVKQVATYCAQQFRGFSPVLSYFRSMYATEQWLENKANPVGWLCAQVRPYSGLMKAYKHYKESKQALPHYFIIIDDDTYYDMEQFQRNFMTMNASEDLYYAGILIHTPRDLLNITYPLGGYGSIFSQGSLHNLFEPIYCPPNPHSTQSYSTLVRHQSLCHRLDENNVYEKHFFKSGMNLAELMYHYTSANRYRDVKDWNDRTESGCGYCMHSDWVIGYFANNYNVSKHVADPYYADVPHARIEPYQGEIYGTGRRRRFQEKCGDKAGAKVCHYATPEWMKKETDRLRLNAPENFRPVY